MLAFFLFLVIVAIVLGIVGAVGKGLLYLLFIGIAVFLGALVLGALRMRRRPGQPRPRPCCSSPWRPYAPSGGLGRRPGGQSDETDCTRPSGPRARPRLSCGRAACCGRSCDGWLSCPGAAGTGGRPAGPQAGLL